MIPQPKDEKMNPRAEIQILPQLASATTRKTNKPQLIGPRPAFVKSLITPRKIGESVLSNKGPTDKTTDTTQAQFSIESKCMSLEIRSFEIVTRWEKTSERSKIKSTGVLCKMLLAQCEKTKHVKANVNKKVGWDKRIGQSMR